jgi:hypothetical protein
MLSILIPEGLIAKPPLVYGRALALMLKLKLR